MMHYVLVAMIVVIGGGVILHHFFRKDAEVRRTIKQAPSTTIDRFPETGVARVSGLLEIVGEPMRAPMTNRPCAGYHLVVQRWRSSGNSGSWRTIIDEHVLQDFALVDEERRAIVMADGALIALEKDATKKSGTFNSPPVALVKMLNERGHDAKTTFGFNKRLRYREGVLEPGETVTVRGTAFRPASDDDAFSGYDLVIARPNAEPMYVSDHPSVIAKPDPYGAGPRV